MTTRQDFVVTLMSIRLSIQDGREARLAEGELGDAARARYVMLREWRMWVGEVSEGGARTGGNSLRGRDFLEHELTDNSRPTLCHKYVLHTKYIED